MENLDRFESENLPVLDEIKNALLHLHEAKDTDNDPAEAKWADNYSHQFDVIATDGELLGRYRNADPAEREKIIGEIDGIIQSLPPIEKKDEETPQ